MGHRLAGVLWIMLFLSPRAYAFNNDVSLRGLGRPLSDDLRDPANVRYQALTSELLLALTPHALQGAETTGLSGFEVSLADTATPISSQAAFWRGQPGAPVLEAGIQGGEVPRVLWTPTLRMRKGLGLNTELGIAGTFLPHSRLAMLSGEIKVAVHESFARWVPSIALRGAGHRLLGSTDADMIVAEVGGIMSLRLPIAGVGQLTPYVGFSELFAQVTSQILDATPYAVSDSSNDQVGGPQGALYQLATLNLLQNRLQRLYGGVRLNIAMVTSLYEVGTNSYGGTTLVSHSFKLGFEI